ncbi:MAG: O-antigen ligase family protein [Bacteroidales bacterium]|jgi:hypothetical protein|nr:O-antigen ligase family protein [Bacteroidales bacterium]
MTNLDLKYFKNLSLSELGLWLLIPLASLSSRTWLPVPPTLLLLLGAILCWAIQQMNGKWKMENGELSYLAKPHSQFQTIIRVFSLFCLYFSVSQYLMGTAFFRYMGVVFAPMYLIFVLIFSSDVSSDFLKKLGDKFIRYSLVILCIEAILRYGYSFWCIIQGENHYHGIYQFKFDGPMYIASNMLAGHIIALLFFILWWGHTHKQSMKKELLVAFILLILTLSRASIPAVFAGLAYYCFFRNLNWKKALLVFFSLCFVAILSLWALKFLLSDGSFQTKFLILDEALDYYKTANLKNILFGLGLSETEQIARFTYSAHNYFLLFLMETGVFGLLFLGITWFVLVKATNGAAMIILLPYFVQISAEAATFIPYFYVIMALMITNKLKIENDSKKNTLLLD